MVMTAAQFPLASFLVRFSMGLFCSGLGTGYISRGPIIIGGGTTRNRGSVGCCG